MNSGKNSDWKIEYDEGFADDLRKLGRPVQLRVKKYLDKLQKDCSHPRERGEPLKANLAGFWKYRIGDYRLICKIVDNEIVILCLLAASHRSRSYSAKRVDELMKRALALEEQLQP